MTDAELLDLAVAMRAAQEDFYRNGRTREQLAAARRLEKAFDQAVADRRRGPTLFDARRDGA